MDGTVIGENEEWRSYKMHDDFYQMYLDEIREVVPCTEKEQAELTARVIDGDEAAKTRLIEGNLHQALEAAKEYDGRGVLLTDLVQEANMAILLAVETYCRAGKESSFEMILKESFHRTLEQAVEDEVEAGRTEEEITARVNVLQKVAAMMAQELGREATVEELAVKMKMTEYEVNNIMKMAMNALGVDAENMRCKRL